MLPGVVLSLINTLILIVSQSLGIAGGTASCPLTVVKAQWEGQMFSLVPVRKAGRLSS